MRVRGSKRPLAGVAAHAVIILALLLAITQSYAADFRAEIVERRQEVYNNFYNNYLHKGKTEQEAEKKALKKKKVVIYDQLLEIIDEMENEPDPAKSAHLSQVAYEIESSLKRSGPDLTSVMLAKYGKALLSEWSIPKDSPIRKEAANLVDPANGKILTTKDLKKLGKDFDFSLLDPKPKTSFWRKPLDISKVDVKSAVTNGHSPVHEGITIEFPNEPVFFDEVIKSQTKPKIKVFIRNKKGKKVQFKLKFGKEIHSDPTVTALLTALGYNTDTVKYVKNVKVYLDGNSLKDLKQDWMSYYGNGGATQQYGEYDVDSFIKEEGQDGNGKYVIFTEGLLEAKPKKMIRVGPWSYEELNHDKWREARGLFLFNIWVTNTDWDGENNKLVLRKIDDEYQIFHVPHDLGHTFGGVLGERPKHLPWDFVKQSHEKLVFRYNSYHDNGLRKQLTFSDGKWMARNIAQLTRKQIREAVSLGHWSPAEEKELVEALISRRNNLVESFQLKGETLHNGAVIDTIPINKELQTKDPTYYQDLLGPIFQVIKDGGVSAFQAGVGHIDKIDIDPVEIGLDQGLVSQILVHVSRNVMENPNPTSADDLFLVQDVVHLGMRLGVGIVLTGEASYMKRFTLVYPVPTAHDGQYANKSILNLTLPFKLAKQKLPDNYVLMIEDFIEGRGRIQLSPGGPITLGTEMTSSKYNVSRIVIENKNRDDLVLYKDKSKYNELAGRIFMKLGLIKFSLLRAGIQFDGRTDGKAFFLKKADIDVNPIIAEAVDSVIRASDMVGIPQHAKSTDVSSEFENKFVRLSLPFIVGSYSKESSKISDKLTLVQDGQEPETYYRYKQERTSAWSFIDNGEEHQLRTYILADVTKKEPTYPVVHLGFWSKDNRTMTKELETGFLEFANNLTEKELIDFSPRLHNHNKKWGTLEFHTNITLYPNAIKAIVQMTDEKFWRAMELVMSVHEDELLKHRRAGPDKADREFLDGDLLEVVAAGKDFLKNLRKAKTGKDTKYGLKFLAKAFHKANYRKKHYYEPWVMATILEVIGPRRYYLDVRLGPPGNQENRLPGELAFRNSYGTEQAFRNLSFLLFPLDGAELYHMFGGL